MTIESYYLIKEEALSALQNEVNKYIKAGFEPHGSLAIRVLGANSYFYIQPMIKYNSFCKQKKSHEFS